MMEQVDMNRRAAAILDAWDPFQLGEGRYDTETADVLAQLQHIDRPDELGKQIQRIYEHSFERWIPIESCVDVSYKLMGVKYEYKCIL